MHAAQTSWALERCSRDYTARVSASLCSQCRAPLPPATGLVTCSFCGTSNTVQQPIGPTQIRAAVRQVLAEERAPDSSPATRVRPLVVVVAGLVLMGLAGTVVALTSAVPPPHSKFRPTIAVPSVPKVLPPLPTPVVEAPATNSGLGVPSSLAFGGHHSLLAVVGNEVIKVDLESMRPLWRAPVTGGEGTVLEVADRAVFAGPEGAFFFDAQSGTPTGKYLFKTSGFKVTACAAGPQQVLVKTVFDGVLRFDVTQAAPAKGSTSCHFNEDLHCDVGQRCAFDHSEVGGLSCRYVLHVQGARVTFCEVDGTKEKVLVSHTGSQVHWKTPRGPGSSTNPSYASVVSGVLVTADDDLLEGFDPANGERRWSHPLTGSGRAVISDGRRLFFGHAGTVKVLDAKTGEEVTRVERR